VSVLFLILLLESHSAPLKTGLVSLLNTLPFLVFGVISGALVDRFNRKRLMLGSDLLRGILLAMVPVAYMSGFLTWWVVALVGFLLATFFHGIQSGKGCGWCSKTRSRR
jgi:MFS family permease